MTETLFRTLTDTPVGRLQIITSAEGVVAILWPDDERWSYHTVDASNEICEATVAQLAEFFAGERTDFELPLDLRGTDFQVQVWRSLVSIPFGQTLSYAEQARRLGRPTAVRAVASANASNPVSIVLPCHRVVGADGRLTGYAGGLDNKKWLLDHEGGR
jgi:methylated-DNA-[protein]-cysteine S-methyltransferase